MKALFVPRSIAVVGGSNDLGKPGGRVVANLKRGSFSPLWIVNPRGEPVQDLPTFPSVDALPEAPDLAIVSVPAAHTLKAVQALLRRGTRAFNVLTAGFSELDDEGRRMERELVEVVQAAGAHMIGPNSMGIFTPAHLGTFGGPPLTPMPDGVDVISASGAMAAFIFDAGLERGVRFASLVSVGNSAQYGVEDVLAYQAEQPELFKGRVKVLYMEQLKNPALLLSAARACAKRGVRIVALKTGATQAGSRAASSHTGAMATPDVAVSALFDKAGIVRVVSRTELLDVACVLAEPRIPRGKRVAVVTHAGGPGVALVDELSRQGMEVPELPSSVQERLRAQLLPGSAVGNPIDFLAAGTAGHLKQIFEALRTQGEGSIDSVCVVYGSPGLFDVTAPLETIARTVREFPIPVYPVLPSPVTARAEVARYREQGGQYFTDEVQLARALALVARTPPTIATDDRAPLQDEAAAREVVQNARAKGLTQLPPDAVRQLLLAAGFTFPRQKVAREENEAASVAGAMGYPVVLKVVGPVHKSDVGGVAVGLRDESAVRTAFRRMMTIPDAEGVLLQEQLSGLELILGASRHPGIGQVMLFGLGGIFVEALGDVATALAPLSLPEAHRLIRSTKASSLLAGLRGRPGVDVDALAELLVRLSSLVSAFPEIAELDVNPLMGMGSQLRVADARVRIVTGSAHPVHPHSAHG